jgi:predicted naringenin-chalcone synthase
MPLDAELSEDILALIERLSREEVANMLQTQEASATTA